MVQAVLWCSGGWAAQGACSSVPWIYRGGLAWLGKRLIYGPWIIYKSMLKTILNGYWINLNTNSAWVKVKHNFSITFLWSYQSVSSIASLKSSKIVKSQPSSSLRHAVSACRPCCPLRFGRLLPRFYGFEGPGVSRESDQSWILQWIEEQRFHHGVQQEGRVFTDASAGCLLLRPCTQGWVGGLWKTSRRQISGQWELQTTSELQEIGSSDYQGRMPKNPFQTYQEEDEGHPLHQVPCGLHHGFCHETRSFQQSRHQRRRGGQVHSGWQISHFCTAKEDGRPAVSWYILNILKLS